MSERKTAKTGQQSESEKPVELKEQELEKAQGGWVKPCPSHRTKK